MCSQDLPSTQHHESQERRTHHFCAGIESEKILPNGYLGTSARLCCTRLHSASRLRHMSAMSQSIFQVSLLHYERQAFAVLCVFHCCTVVKRPAKSYRLDHALSWPGLCAVLSFARSYRHIVTSVAGIVTIRHICNST